MKKDIYNRIIEVYSNDSFYVHHKNIWDDREGFECTTFKTKDEYRPNKVSDLKKAMTELKALGIKNHHTIKSAFEFVNLITSYTCITYDKITEKVRVINFEHGYKYSYKKERFYPYRGSFPILTYSDKVYFFTYKKKKRGTRLFTGRTNREESIFHKLGTAILGKDMKTSLPVCLTKYMNVTDEYQVLEKELGIKIPKTLRVFEPADLYNFIKPLKNRQEINTICQYIAKNGYYQDPRPTSFLDDKKNTTSLVSTICEIMFGKPDEKIDPRWLFNDYITDLHALKKTYSLKIRSINRVRDEHNKYSKIRRFKQMKDIKTHNIYKVLIDGFPFEAELIDDKKTLLQESIRQDHCVSTYGDRINNGQCAIFTMMNEGIRWTAEITVNVLLTGNKFTLRQLQGLRNELIPPPGMKDLIVQHLEKFSVQMTKDLPASEQNYAVDVF